MAAKEFFQNAAFVFGGYRWWAAFKHKFDDEFPNSLSGAEATPGVVRREASGPCTYCKTATHWFNTVLEVWICSVECRTMAARAVEREIDDLTRREIGD